MLTCCACVTVHVSLWRIEVSLATHTGQKDGQNVAIFLWNYSYMYPYIQLWSLFSREHVAHGNHTIGHSFYQPQFPSITSTSEDSLMLAAPRIIAGYPLDYPLETSWAVRLPHPEPRPAARRREQPPAAASTCQCSYCQLRRRTSCHPTYYLPQLDNYDLSYATTAPITAPTTRTAAAAFASPPGATGTSYSMHICLPGFYLYN